MEEIKANGVLVVANQVQLLHKYSIIIIYYVHSIITNLIYFLQIKIIGFMGSHEEERPEPIV